MSAPGRVVAAGAGALQISSAFMAWTATGIVGLDVAAGSSLRVGLALILVAAVPLVAMLVGDHGWPRVIAGALTALLVLGHLAGGPDGSATTGVMMAAVAAIGQWLAAALANGPVEIARLDRA